MVATIGGDSYNERCAYSDSVRPPDLIGILALSG